MRKWNKKKKKRVRNRIQGIPKESHQNHHWRNLEAEVLHRKIQVREKREENEKKRESRKRQRRRRRELLIQIAQSIGWS